MADYYETLGVPEDANVHEIKRAFREKAFDHHPDANRAAGAQAKKKFQKILEAYETLKDPHKRAQYDALRRGSLDPSQTFDTWSGTGYTRRKTAANDWERQFDEWLRRMKSEFGEEFGATDSERIRRERASAERVARAEAWEREKKEAKEIRLRSARVKRRAEDAAQARRAATLRRFWQAHPGFTWQDAVVGSLFVLSSVGLALYWRGVVRERTSSGNPNENT